MVEINNVTGGTWVNYKQETPGVFGGGGGAGSPNAYPMPDPTDGTWQITAPTNVDGDIPIWSSLSSSTSEQYNGSPGQKGGDGFFCIFIQENQKSSDSNCSYTDPNSLINNYESNLPSFLTITSATPNEQGVGPTIYGNASSFSNAYDGTTSVSGKIQYSSGEPYLSILVGPGNYTIETNSPTASFLLTAGGGGGAGGPTFPYSYQADYYYSAKGGALNDAYIAGGGGCGSGGGGGGAVIAQQMFLYTSSNSTPTQNSIITKFTVSVGIGGQGGAGGIAPTGPNQNLNGKVAGTAGDAGFESTLFIEQYAMGPYAQILPIKYTCSPGLGGEVPTKLNQNNEIYNLTFGGAGGAGGVIDQSMNINPGVSIESNYFTLENYRGGDGSCTTTSGYYNDVTFTINGDGYGPYNYQNADLSVTNLPVGWGVSCETMAVPVYKNASGVVQNDYWFYINAGGGGGGSSGYGCYNGYANFTNSPYFKKIPVDYVQSGGGGGGLGGTAPIFIPNVNNPDPLKWISLVLNIVSFIPELSNLTTDPLTTAVDGANIFLGILT